jgi:hypothetical protein
MLALLQSEPHRSQFPFSGRASSIVRSRGPEILRYICHARVLSMTQMPHATTRS